MNHKNYELLDFGNGRKLERFGEVVLDRPSPSAEHATQQAPSLWKQAELRFTNKTNRSDSERGKWKKLTGGNTKETWNVEFILSGITELNQLAFKQAEPAGVEQTGIEQAVPTFLSSQKNKEAVLKFNLQRSPFGHVGLFAEQYENWKWIAKQVQRNQKRTKRRTKVLNLFGYTGGSTLAAASAGGEVVHVDAAKNSVAKARVNAELSQLKTCPIRWITEDAMKFCQREVKRGNKYDAVILDPPSYGHGPQGETWRLERDLLPMLNLCKELTSENRGFLLLTCHSPGIGPAELGAYLSDGIFGSCGQAPKCGRMEIQATTGKRLPSGNYARWPN